MTDELPTYTYQFYKFVWSSIRLTRPYKQFFIFTGFISATCDWINAYGTTRHRKSVNSRRSKLYIRLKAFHRKHVILSCYMISAWFYSLYIQPFVHAKPYNCTQQINPNESRLSDNTNLILHTDKQNAPLIGRTPLQNKILLQALYAFQAPQKQLAHTCFDSDAFDICVNTGASSTCTPSKDDFIPDTYVLITG